MAFTFSPLKHFTSVSVNCCDNSERAYVQRFARTLINRGWTQDETCDGYFTRCLLISPDGKSVMKISGDCRDDGMPVRDAFKDFARWAITQTTPHLPKFYRMGSLRKFGLFVTVMERLDRVPCEINDDMFDIPYHEYEIPADKKNREVMALLELSSMRHNRNRSVDTTTRQVSESLGRFVKKMVDVLGWPNDLHSGNIMLRGNTPVILDPYARFSYQKSPDGKICPDPCNSFEF